PRHGVQVVDVAHVTSIPFDPGLPLVILRSESAPAASANSEAGSSPEEVTSLPGRQREPGASRLLMRLYPGAHQARRIADGTRVPIEALTDADLAADDWVIPALNAVENLGSPHGMAAISARLRAPNGCPWDRKQTHASLRPFVLEEAYETVDAIERGGAADLAEELGDLFLQVVLHAQLAAEEGTFDLVDVYRTLGAK